MMKRICAFISRCGSGYMRWTNKKLLVTRQKCSLLSGCWWIFIWPILTTQKRKSSPSSESFSTKASSLFIKKTRPTTWDQNLPVFTTYWPASPFSTSFMSSSEKGSTPCAKFSETTFMKSLLTPKALNISRTQSRTKMSIRSSFNSSKIWLSFASITSGSMGHGA